MNPSSASASTSAAFSDHTATVNDVSLHFQAGGKGTPVVLLHGFAETGHMWRPVMDNLAQVPPFSASVADHQPNVSA
jgi:pimeloyl-ACP methyl ester carboxylesterase